MPNLKNAEKALRQSKKRQQSNYSVKENLSWLKKKTLKAIESKSEEAKELMNKVIKEVDKATKKGLIKKNTANRNKSRIMKKFNAAFSPKK